MKKFLCVFLVIIIVAFVGVVSISGYNEFVNKDSAIKVMSFNIRCIALESNSANSWSNRQDKVLQLLENFDADIIGFQELKEAQYKFLRESLVEYDYYGEHRSASMLLSEASAIFWKKDRFEALEKETFWLSQTPEQMSRGWDAQLERVCTQIKFKDKMTGRIFTHFNTHFDHRGYIAREQSVNLILQRIEDNATPTILTGDLNFAEGSSHYQNLTSQTLKDTKYSAPKDSTDFGPTFNGFGNSTHTKPIDFILADDNFIIHSYKILRNEDEDGNYPSDHFPIISRLEQIN